MSRSLAERKLAELPFAGTVPSPQVENDKMITGHWRVQRPVIEAEKCTQCWQCWIYCADACITRGDAPVFNYKYWQRLWSLCQRVPHRRNHHGSRA